jgi:outer membrane biosynthesis protein TonB
MDPYDDQEISFFQKHKAIILCGLAVIIAGGVWLGRKRFEQKPQLLAQDNFILANLPPPPPPTPPSAPPPPPPQELKQEMITQEEVDPSETKPEQAPGNDAPALGLGTNIQGDGSGDSFGLRANKNAGSGAGQIAIRKKSSRWGWYANQVQRAIAQALQSNDRTRTAEFRVEARIWADKSGRITRARLNGSTGIEGIDHAITNQVLAGLILQEPPPDGMPMPIVLRLTARPAKLALAR